MSDKIEPQYQAPDLSQETILRRYARRFPGYRLSNYGRVASPIYRMHVSVIKITKKKIPVLHEFVLRTIDAGLSHAADIAGFLGLERTTVNVALSELITSEGIVLTGSEGDRSHRLLITEQGKGTLSSSILEKLEEDVEVIYFDGLSRRIVRDDKDRFLTHSEIGKEGIVELAPYPRSRPKVEDIREEFCRVFKQDNPGFDLVAVLSIERIQTLFQADAMVITYRPDAPMDDKSLTTQIGFIFAGHWSDEHAEAFRRSNADSHISIATDLILDEAMGELKRDFEQYLAELESNNVNEEDDWEDDECARSAKSSGRKGGNKERSKGRRRFDESHTGYEGQFISKPPLSTGTNEIAIEPYNHEAWLEDALANAVERIIIIAPDISSSVVNQIFIGTLEKALRRDVKVYIGCEIDPDIQISARLLKLETKFNNFCVRKINQTNPCLLICDSKFIILTTFKWLSFKGNLRNAFRDDIGYYIDRSDYVNYVYKKYLLIIKNGKVIVRSPVET